MFVDQVLSEQLQKEWVSPVYVFFGSMPVIKEIDGCWVHEFKCSARGCKVRICCYLDMKDAWSTSNMQKHVKWCWGGDVLSAADNAKDANEVRTKIVGSILCNDSITAIFEWKGKGKVTYSHWQHTQSEMRGEIVRWVSESLHPFQIVKDRGFQCLMKTGRPQCYLPSPETVSCDVKQVFTCTQKHTVHLLIMYGV
ncbi:hypothetical protein PISMIDRAFT_120461 [Pisolithus microcarpus 441]|uniref:Uncharacterized protein n=1 Tax=Pisolithus microcarpus 441 TaxID=765257 RepID=A0A0C9Y6W3_9AGAM|nr:hypothetical protein BKA83DRAFT_120461 [Pisolithus microcarpus]KIK12671.1 hypothetical protein PISMIDRAFT_120461 [Pisolithus microcarpus 441]